jgi:hypothetical protein
MTPPLAGNRAEKKRRYRVFLNGKRGMNRCVYAKSRPTTKGFSPLARIPPEAEIPLHPYFHAARLKQTISYGKAEQPCNKHVRGIITRLRNERQDWAILFQQF